MKKGPGRELSIIEESRRGVNRKGFDYFENVIFYLSIHH